MTIRILFALTAIFWVIMNVLLWRTEYGGRDSAPVPLDTVWERVLTAADSSSLQVYHHRQMLGIFRWTPSVVEAADTGANANDASAGLEGMVRRTEGYRIELDGTLQMSEPLQRLRASGFAEFGTNHAWREFGTTFLQRPNSWEVGAKAGDDGVRIAWKDGAARLERKFRYADLANPGRLLGDLGGFIGPGLLPGAQLFAGGTNGLAGRLQWSAVNDTLKVGGARLRVYRVSARLLQGYEAVVYISRAGEILRIELPDQIRIVNTALPSL